MQVAAAANLLANAGFELDANNDGRPDQWSASANVTRSSLVKRSHSWR